MIKHPMSLHFRLPQFMLSLTMPVFEGCDNLSPTTLPFELFMPSKFSKSLISYLQSLFRVLPSLFTFATNWPFNATPINPVGNIVFFNLSNYVLTWIRNLTSPLLTHFSNWYTFYKLLNCYFSVSMS